MFFLGWYFPISNTNTVNMFISPTNKTLGAQWLHQNCNHSLIMLSDRVSYHVSMSVNERWEMVVWMLFKGDIHNPLIPFDVPVKQSKNIL